MSWGGTEQKLNRERRNRNIKKDLLKYIKQVLCYQLILNISYAGIRPVIKISTNNPKMAYNSGNTANTIVVPNTL